MARKVYPVLPRIESDPVFRVGWAPLLVFPLDRERDGTVGIYAKLGQHCTAALSYIRENTRPPRTVEEWRACLDLIEEERTLPPEDERLEARIVARLR